MAAPMHYDDQPTRVASPVRPRQQTDSRRGQQTVPQARQYPRKQNSANPNRMSAVPGQNYARTQTVNRPHTAQRAGTNGQPMRPRRTSASYAGRQMPRRTAVKQPRPKINYRGIFKKCLRRLALFAVMFVVLFAFCGGIFLLTVYTGNSTASRKFTYQIGSDDNVISQNVVRSDTLYRRGVLYLDITALAAYCNFTTTGDIRTLRFISGDGGNENVCFTVDSPIITVNEVPVRLSAPVLREEDDILVPVEFFERYTQGIDFSIDTEKGKITFARTVDPVYSTKEKPVYEDITFSVKTPSVSEHIAEDSLGLDFLDQTDPIKIAAAQELAKYQAQQAQQNDTQNDAQ